MSDISYTAGYQINRIKQNIAKAYTSALNKGATEPENMNSDNLQSTIDSIKVADVLYDPTLRRLTITTSSKAVT